jgi:hypothetical protein
LEKVNPIQQHITDSGHCNLRRLCNNGVGKEIFAGRKTAQKWNEGVDVSLTIMLVCAVLASLGAGVLLAYGVCVAMFHVFRMHVSQLAAEETAGRVAIPAQVAKS